MLLYSDYISTQIFGIRPAYICSQFQTINSITVVRAVNVENAVAF